MITDNKPHRKALYVPGLRYLMLLTVPLLGVFAPSPPMVAAGGQTDGLACQRVVMAGFVAGNWDLVLFDSVFQRYVNLTQSPFDERDPAWSSDGHTIAYSAKVGNNWDLYRYHLETGVSEQLTEDAAYDGHPAWSPDDRQLLFESTRDGNLDIFLLDLETRAVTQLTSERWPDVEPLWLPDGNAFIFTSWRNGSRQLFRQDLVGGLAVEITDLGEEPRQATLTSDSLLVYVRDGVSVTEIAQRDLVRHTVTVLPTMGTHTWPAILGRGQTSALVTLELMQGQINEYPIGWQLSIRNLADQQKQLLLPLRGDWQQPVCGSPVPFDPQRDWRSVNQLNIDAYLATLDPPGPQQLEKLAGVYALNPVLSSAVVPAFQQLRERILTESGYDFLRTINDAWRGLDHPSGETISWHRTGRVFDARDWFATDQQRLYIAREQLGLRTYFRIYLLARQQDGSRGRPLRESLWITDGRLADAQMLAQGGRYGIPPAGYFVDITDLATREGWTRIPGLTPPQGDWRSHYLDIEFWHYERRGGLRWYTAMRQLYSEQELSARYSVNRLLGLNYTEEEIQYAGIPAHVQFACNLRKKQMNVVSFWMPTQCGKTSGHMYTLAR